MIRIRTQIAEYILIIVADYSKRATYDNENPNVIPYLGFAIRTDCLMLGMSGSEIPVISFAPFLTGDAGQRQSVAKEIFQAFHTIGFLYLTDSGITQERIDGIFALVST